MHWICLFFFSSSLGLFFTHFFYPGKLLRLYQCYKEANSPPCFSVWRWVMWKYTSCKDSTAGEESHWTQAPCKRYEKNGASLSIWEGECAWEVRTQYGGTRFPAQKLSGDENAVSSCRQWLLSVAAPGDEWRWRFDLSTQPLFSMLPWESRNARLDLTETTKPPRFFLLERGQCYSKHNAARAKSATLTPPRTKISMLPCNC